MGTLLECAGRLLVLGWLAAAMAAGAATPSVPPAFTDPSLVRQSFAALELPFEANVGQFDARVAFAARTFSGSTFVTRDGRIVHALHDAAGSRGWNLVERLVGGQANPRGTTPHVTRVARLTGSDAAGGHSDIPTWRAVSLGEPWDGIEVSLEAKGRNVEKLFTVAPGADAARIRVSVEGAERLDVDATGALVVTTGGGPVRFTAPVAWQAIGDERHAVSVSYSAAGMEYGFRLGSHDPRVPVVIDPLLQSTFYGGGSPFDPPSGVALDAAGNVYVAGSTSSIIIPGMEGGAQPTPIGFGSYVAKLSPDLKVLIQATLLGGTASALAVDATGNVYVAGRVSSFASGFPSTAGGAQATFGGEFDGFVVKLAGDLKSFIQATYLGGSGTDFVNAMALDVGGDVIVTGNTTSTNLPGTAGSTQPSNAGGSDAFVARVSGDLRTLVRATYLGGSGGDSAAALVMDADGLVYVAGSTNSANLPGVQGGAQSTIGGADDAFVARLSGDLTSLLQASYLGGASWDAPTGLAMGSGDALFVAGTTSSANFPRTAGGAQPTPASGSGKGFVARLARDLKSILQATYLGGSGQDSPAALALDGAGNLFVAGNANSTDFPGTVVGQPATGGDAFVAKLAGDLKTLVQATYVSGGKRDGATAIAIDAGGNVVLAGFTDSTDFPGTSGGALPFISGAGDGFIARLTPDLLPGPAAGFRVAVQSTASPDRPITVTGGISFNVTVTALDGSGNLARGYAGTLRWTSTDSAAVLPADATITNGSGVFQVILKILGQQTLTVTDSVAASIARTTDPITVEPAPVARLALATPAAVTAGAPFNVTVTAVDAANNIVVGYARTVRITSSDPAVTFADVSLSGGVGTFQATLRTVGNQTLTATEVFYPAITGTSDAILVSPPFHLTLSAPAGATAGAPFTVTVTARDAANNVATGYAGTVRITSTDGAAVLPPDATLTSGTGSFSVTLKTAGTQTVLARDTVDAIVTGASATVAVTAGAAMSLSVAAPHSVGPDAAFSFTVTARDAHGNAAPGYAGTVRFTSTDGAATLPPDSTITSGSGTFAATLRTLGVQTITATDVAASAFAGTSNAIGVTRLVPSASSVDFGGQSMGTSSPPFTLTVTNLTTSPVDVTGIALSSTQFTQANDCASLAAGASCTITLVFKPAVSAGALGSVVEVSGNLSLASPAGDLVVGLSGRAERSLVTHYYRSILRRAPDDDGKAFWNAEAVRVQGMGLNVNEVWFAMAQQFYTSLEYVVLQRDDTGFVTDLYNTFFNRTPDADGLAYWVGHFDHGMPREVVLTAFMFSAEFANFAQAIFGDTAVRAEINVVTDFYRGLLSRLPDVGGFNYWLGRFRIAQCAGSSASNAVTEAAGQISRLFASSQEYANRFRIDSQYVGDMYNAFMRRGGDLDGVKYWIDRTYSAGRVSVLGSFVSSPEFQARVAAIIAQGCMTQ